MMLRPEIEEIWLEKLEIKKKKKKSTYVHFDHRIKDPKKFLTLISDENRIASHAFLPFVKFDKPKYKYKNIGKNDKRVLVKKVREIMYSGHLDSLIYTWYQSILEELYNEILIKYGLSDVVLAYRRIQKKDAASGKCNIDFAIEVFSEVKLRGEECVVLTFDIENFFPSLSHNHLKKKWSELLQKQMLPEDHYNVFKSLTKYSYINLTSDSVKKLLKYRTKGQYAHNHAFSGGKYFSSKNFRHIKSKIRELENSSGEDLFCTNSDKKGIPQGSPMSGLLANIYMLDFDKDINEVVKRAGGIYKRYSDDIIVVISKDEASSIENIIQNRVETEKDEKNNPYLVINAGKTNRTFFSQFNGRLIASKLDDDYKIVGKKTLQYLGFEFDGKDVVIRSGSIAKFYTQLKFGLRRIKSKYKRGPLLRRKLFSRFTPLGKKNFFSYVKKSQKIVKGNKLEKQLRKHKQLIENSVKKIEIK